MKVNKEFVGEFISLKNDEYLQKQRISGRVTRETLNILGDLVLSRSPFSLLEMSKIAEEYILKNNCTPTFKGYKGFPEAVCISINHELVHGIPFKYKLQEGDIVSFDLGATYENVISDSAITCIFGNPKSEQHIKLVATTKECLNKAIAAIKVGAKIGVIGDAIYRHAKKNNFNVNEDYGGHGLEISKPHASPFIGNKADPNDGVRIQEGMSLAIEPILTTGSKFTKIAQDGWTVVGDINSVSSHFEKTIYVHKDRVEIIT